MKPYKVWEIIAPSASFWIELKLKIYE